MRVWRTSERTASLFERARVKREETFAGTFIANSLQNRSPVQRAIVRTSWIRERKVARVERSTVLRPVFQHSFATVKTLSNLPSLFTPADTPCLQHDFAILFYFLSHRAAIILRPLPLKSDRFTSDESANSENYWYSDRVTTSRKRAILSIYRVETTGDSTRRLNDLKSFKSLVTCRMDAIT